MLRKIAAKTLNFFQNLSSVSQGLTIITLKDPFVFVFGIVAGTPIGYAVSKIVFSRLFKKQEDAITLENAVKYQAIKQGLNCLLGFVLGTAVISPQLRTLLLMFWRAV